MTERSNSVMLFLILVAVFDLDHSWKYSMFLGLIGFVMSFIAPFISDIISEKRPPR